MVELVEVCRSFIAVIGMATPSGKPCLGGSCPIRPISLDTYVNFSVKMGILQIKSQLILKSKLSVRSLDTV